MQRAIEMHPREDYEPFQIEVTEPGTLRRIVTGMKPPKTIIAASMGKPPAAEIQPIPALLFEVDPSKPKRARKFVWLPCETKLTYPGKLEFRDTYVDEATGAPLILYEVVTT